MTWPAVTQTIFFTADVKLINEKVCQVWLRCSPSFSSYPRKTTGGPTRAKVNEWLSVFWYPSIILAKSMKREWKYAINSFFVKLPTISTSNCRKMYLVREACTSSLYSPLSPLSARLCRDVTPAARFLYPIQYNAILPKVTEVYRRKYTWHICKNCFIRKFGPQCLVKSS